MPYIDITPGDQPGFTFVEDPPPKRESAREAPGLALGPVTPEQVKAIEDSADPSRRMIRAALANASLSEYDPERVIVAHKIARDIGIAPAVVVQHLEEIRRERVLEQTDALLRGSPRTSKHVFEDLNRVNLLYPDIPLITKAERGFEFSRLPSAFMSGWYGAGEGVAGLGEAVADLVPGESPNAKEIRRGATLARKIEEPGADSIIGRGVYGAAASLGQMAPALPLLAFGPAGAAGFLAYLLATSFGKSYGQASDKGMSVFDRQGYAAAGAFVEGATEMSPASSLGMAVAEAMGGGKFRRHLLDFLRNEAIGEQAATFQGDVAEALFIAPKSLGQFLSERPARAAETLISTALASGVMAGGVSAASLMAGRPQGASRAPDVLEAVAKDVGSAKVASADPVAFDAAMAAAAGNARTVYIDGAALLQSGIDLSVLSEEVRDQLPAASSGGTVAIPVGEYLRTVVGGGHHQKVRDDIKFDPQFEFTANEAREFEESGAKDDFLESMDRTFGKKAGDQPFMRGVATLKQTILSDLTSPEAGITALERPVLDTLAQMRSLYFNIRAEQMGMAPEDLYRALGGKTRQVDSIEAAPGMQAQEGKEGPLGAFDAKTLETLFSPRANRSTPFHEAQHHFFESDIILSTQLLRRKIEGEALTDQASSLISDASSALKWAGVKGKTVEQQIAAWKALSDADRSKAHEKIAEAYERYLLEGKAPSFEMGRYFESLTRWIKGVYLTLKGLIAQRPGAAEIDPTIRAYFDRQLATDDQIELARIGRSLMPLFANRESSGMSEEDYTAYHAMFGASVDEAKAALRKQAVPDMLYVFDVHSKALDKIRKQNESEWKAARAAARKQVLDRPVYRAWKFLTDPLSRNDAETLRPREPERVSSTAVDPTADSMFDAIAKLGGLKWASLREELGVDPAHRSPRQRGAFVWKKDGSGRDVGGMIELLGGYGYLTQDEHGKVDHAEFEAKFFEELRGNKQVTPQYNYDRDEEYVPGAQVAYPWKLKSGRLDRGALFALGLQQEQVDVLEGYGMVAKRGGLDPDQVSGLYEDEDGEAVWTSGSEMVHDILETAPMDQEVERIASETMRTEHGELTSDVSMLLAADEAVHSDVMARLAATEHAALLKMIDAKVETGKQTKTGKPVMRSILPAAAREFARNSINRLRSGKVSARQYASAAARSARASKKALEAGDLEAAATEKRNQVVQLQMAREAYQARSDAKKLRKLISSLGKREVRKGLSLDYLRLIDAAIEGFGVNIGEVPQYAQDVAYEDRDFVISAVRANTKKGRTREELQAAIDKALGDIANKRGEEAPLDIPAPNPGRNISDVTVGELRDFAAQLEGLVDFGRKEQILLSKEDKRKLDERKNAFASSVRTNADAKGKGPLGPEDKSPLKAVGRAKEIGKGWAQWITRGYAHAHVLDNGNLAGEAHRALQYPAQDATTRQQDLNSEYGAKLTAALKPVLAEVRAPFVGRMLNRRYVRQMRRDMSVDDIWTMALNLANPSNIKRLIDGENAWNRSKGYDELTLDDVKDIVRENLNGEQIRALQKVWDLHEPLGKDAFDIEERINHKRPVKIESSPITLQSRDGETITLRGGYYPVNFDFDRITRLLGRLVAGRIQSRPWSTVEMGFLKPRVDEVEGMPLRYDIESVGKGFSRAIHHNTWRETLIDMNKIVNSDEVREAIGERYGPSMLSAIDQWLQQLKEPGVSSAPEVNSALSALRLNVSVSTQAFNTLSAAVQVTGFANSLGELESPVMLRAAQDVIKNPVAMNRWANEDGFMEHRSATLSREQTENVARMRYRYGYREFVTDFGYVLQQAMQRPVDLITYRAGYLRAMDRMDAEMAAERDAGTLTTDPEELANRIASNEKQARREAAQVVKITQGTGQAMDLAPVEASNEATKLLTLLMNYSITTNTLGYLKLKTSAPVLSKVARIIPLMVLSVLFEQLLRQALQANGDPDNPEDWEKFFKTYAAKQVLLPLTAMPVIREVGGILETAVAGRPGRYEGPLGQRIFWDVENIITQLSQGQNDQALRKSLVTFVSNFTPVPAAQINRSMTGAEALYDDKTTNPLAPVFGYRKP